VSASGEKWTQLHDHGWAYFEKRRWPTFAVNSEITMNTNNDSFFAEPNHAEQESRDLALEALSRLLIWMADARTLQNRGVRTTIALHCVRPDLIGHPTLEQISHRAGCSRQALSKLVESFRLTTGFAP
jgi:hypothetical protein